MCPHAQIQDYRPIRCVIVHGHVLLRQGVRRLLEDEPDMQVAAEAANANEGLREIFDHRPEIVIADAQLFQGAADHIERLILQGSPNSKVLFLTQENSDPPRQTPADGRHAVRQTSAAELVGMVRSAAGGESALNPDVKATDGPEFQIEQLVPRKRGLTTREREVMKLLAEGRTVRSAAGILGLSVKTVDAHKFNLMRKLGIHNKAELVMWAIQKRVVKLPANF